jgi:hypothetical protein
MSTRHLASLLAAAAFGVVLLLSLRTAPVAAETTIQPAACAQWEITSDDLAVTTLTELPEAGKAMIKRAPAGWEPFAIGPTGVLAYRRCVK